MWTDHAQLMNIKQLKVMNKNLPRPRQRVRGNQNCLDFTTQMGFRIEVDDSLQDHLMDINSNRLLVDNDTIIFGVDSTGNFDRFQDFTIIIGDGISIPKKQNHISSPWNKYLWLTELPTVSNPLVNRNGWACTMRKKRPHRDTVAYAMLNNQSIFDVGHHFCYDFADHNLQDLEQYMMRKPFKRNEKDVTLHEQSRVLVKSNKNISGEYLVEGLLGPWHHHSLIELVPEFSCQIFYPTEKTWKPVAAGMPFVMVSCHKFLHRIRKMGFKTFQPFINESYDLETDTNTRISMAFDSFRKFLNKPTHLIEIQEICDHNRKILAKIRQNNYSKHIWKKLRRFITFN